MSERSGDTAGASQQRPFVTALVLLLGIVIGAATVGVVAWTSGSGDSSDTPSTTSADAGFARDMSVHHLQAVEMSSLALENSRDPRVRQLAYDILTTQNNQVGQMHAWLQLWGLPQTSDAEPMSWMGHDMSMMLQPSADGQMPVMPGMATTSQMRSLARARGTAFDRQFLTRMIAHHRAGVMMAQMYLDLGEQPVERSLARTMVVGQTAEMRAMQGMLRQR